MCLAPEAACSVKEDNLPRIDEVWSSVKGIQVAMLSCWNLQTSSQGPFVGERRVFKLPRLQTHPNEALRVAVCLSIKKNLDLYFHILPLPQQCHKGQEAQSQSQGWEMTQWLRALVVLAEDLGSGPGTHTWQLPDVPNSSSKKPDALFWPLQALGMRMMQRQTCRQNTHAHKINKDFKSSHIVKRKKKISRFPMKLIRPRTQKLSN